jgi:hypothetical protein
MINLVKGEKVISQEEQLKQEQLERLIGLITEELNKARSKEELIDMLKWFHNRANGL